MLDRKVVVALSISTVEASKDPTLEKDIRKKDIINMINVIMIMIILEPLEWRLCLTDPV